MIDEEEPLPYTSPVLYCTVCVCVYCIVLYVNCVLCVCAVLYVCVYCTVLYVCGYKDALTAQEDGSHLPVCLTDYTTISR